MCYTDKMIMLCFPVIVNWKVSHLSKYSEQWTLSTAIWSTNQDIGAWLHLQTPEKQRKVWIQHYRETWTHISKIIYIWEA